MMKILVPLYIYPSQAPDSEWQRVASTAATIPVYAIINPNSGPGDALDPENVAGIESLKSAGVKVLGYVYTKYGQRSSAEVNADVQKYSEWYKVHGIFFDEVCVAACKACDVPYYRRLNESATTDFAMDIVMINPGIDPDTGYYSVCHGMVTCENYFDEFDKTATGPVNGQCALLIHTCPTEAEMKRAVTKAGKAGFGWIFVTNDMMPNPWDVLPSYWDSFVHGVASSNSGVSNAHEQTSSAGKKTNGLNAFLNKFKRK